MTKTEFINNLDFETAKNSIAKKLGIKSTELDIKLYKSGHFKINLKNASGNISPLFSESKKAILSSDNLNFKENNGTYEANITIHLKNNFGEYISNIGKIELKKDKFVFYTINDINNNKPNKPNKSNKTETKTKNDDNISNVKTA